MRCQACLSEGARWTPEFEAGGSAAAPATTPSCSPDNSPNRPGFLPVFGSKPEGSFVHPASGAPPRAKNESSVDYAHDGAVCENSERPSRTGREDAIATARRRARLDPGVETPAVAARRLRCPPARRPIARNRPEFAGFSRSNTRKSCMQAIVRARPAQRQHELRNYGGRRGSALRRTAAGG